MKRTAFGSASLIRGQNIGRTTGMRTTMSMSITRATATTSTTGATQGRIAINVF